MVTDDEAAGTMRRSTEQEALANAATVLQLCAEGRLRCSEKTKRPSAATVRLVAESLVSGDFYPDDPIAAFAWPLLVQAGGLARLSNGRLTLTPRGRKALDRRDADVVRGVWGRWPKHAPIDEFSRVEAIKGQRSTSALSAAGPRRQTVGEAVALCPVGEWIGVDDLFAAMRRAGLNPTIARSERGLWRLYLEDPQYGSLGYAGNHDWPILEGRYTLAVLFEYAATLGMLDVEYADPAGARSDFRHIWGADWTDALSRYDGLVAVRLNALGAYAAGLSDVYAPAHVPAGRDLEVLANCHVVATAELPAADRMILDAYADRTFDGAWSLSMATLLAAVERGRPPEDFAAFLAERAANDLPTEVGELLHQATVSAGRLLDRGMCRVVECTDPADAVAIAHDRNLRAHCTLLGDRHLVVPANREAKFRTALHDLGYVIVPQA